MTERDTRSTTLFTTYSKRTEYSLYTYIATHRAFAILLDYSSKYNLHRRSDRNTEKYWEEPAVSPCSRILPSIIIKKSGGKTHSDNAGTLLLGYNSRVKDTDGVDDFSCFTAALHPRRPQWKW